MIFYLDFFLYLFMVTNLFPEKKSLLYEVKNQIDAQMME